MHRRPQHQSRQAKRLAPTMLPAAHPTRTQAPQPSRNPNPGGSAPPDPQTPPPDQLRNSAAASWQPTSGRPPGIPASAALPPPENSIQESPIPHPGQGRSPSAEPPEWNPPKGTPRLPQAPYCHPTPTTKPQAGTESGTPTHTRWWSWSTSTLLKTKDCVARFCETLVICQSN